MTEEIIRFGAGGVPYKPTTPPAPEPEIEVVEEPGVTVEVIEKEADISLFPELRVVDLSKSSGVLKDFSEIKNKVITSIPSKETLKESASKNTHLPSKELIEAGKKLGELKSFILRYPDNAEVQKHAESFYEQCASYTTYPNSIRSLCLYNRSALAKNKGEKFDTSHFSDDIKRVILKPGM